MDVTYPCRACKWFRKNHYETSLSKCANPQLPNDPVSGGVKKQYCEWAREPDGFCGVEGRHWEYGPTWFERLIGGIERKLLDP